MRGWVALCLTVALISPLLGARKRATITNAYLECAPFRETFPAGHYEVHRNVWQLFTAEPAEVMTILAPTDCTFIYAPADLVSFRGRCEMLRYDLDNDMWEVVRSTEWSENGIRTEAWPPGHPCSGGAVP